MHKSCRGWGVRGEAGAWSCLFVVWYPALWGPLPGASQLCCCPLRHSQRRRRSRQNQGALPGRRRQRQARAQKVVLVALGDSWAQARASAFASEASPKSLCCCLPPKRDKGTPVGAGARQGREAPGIILAGGDGLSCTICLGFRTGRAVKIRIKNTE
ncbi:uncharacterized protein VSU04_012749 isoform 1-T1 [Chlamydotis macqueenii]